jgi:hypothetical protein
MGIEAILALAGLIVPPVTDFVKKKFLKKGEDTTEATISSLATTSPDVIPSFMEANTNWLKAKIEWFNRDVIGQPSSWVVDLRASIRPISVILSLLVITLNIKFGFALDENTRAALLLNITSWFGDRIK